MASTIFNGQVANTTPVISATVNYEHSRDGANMRYRVYGRVFLSTNGYYSNRVEINCYLNGSNICSKSEKHSEWNWSWNFDSGWVTVSNKTDGTTPFSFTVKDTQNPSWCNYSSGTYYLDVDPAYFTSTPTFRLTSRTETTAIFSWTTPQTCSTVQYKINDGSWVDVVADANSTSGSFTVSGLSANTNYTIYGDFKRRDSGLWAQTKPSQSVSTYAYPYLTSVPKFTVGDELTIGVYNPLGRSCTVYVIGDDGTEMLGGTFTDTSIYPFNSDSWKNNWYKSLPKKKQGTYKARLVCATGNVDQISSAVEYYLNTSDSGFNPTFPADNIISIANTLHTDISGANKFIKNHNKLTGVIKPMVGKRFADITTGYYNISASGLTTVKKNYSSSNIAFELGNMNSDTFNVTAVDGRGFTTTRSKTIDLVDYNNPGVTTSKITRQNGIGTKAVLAFTGVYTNWTGLLKPNSIQSIRYKIGDSGTWKSLPSNATLTSSNGVWTLNAILDDTFATTSQYDLYLEIKDLLETIVVGAYTISTADAFIWKDLANKRIGINKKPSYSLDVNGTTCSDNFKVGENNNGPWHLHRKTIDLSGSTYDVNTYYPVVADTGIPIGCMHRIGTSVKLNTNKPSWSTHTYGFSLNIEVLEEAFGWGASNQLGIILADDYKFANGKPGWYKQLGNSSRPCFYLRGGGKYFLYTDYLTEWTIYTKSITINEQTVAPTTNAGETVLLTPSYKTALLAYPIGSIYISNSNINPGTIFGGTWVCDRATSGGELLAFGLANTIELGSGEMSANTYYAFSDSLTGKDRHYTVRNYVDGILTGNSGALYVQTKGIVGMIDVTMCISGLSSTTNQGFWFNKNENDLPTGVYVMPNDTRNGCLVGGGATSNGYGGASMNYLYDVNTNNDVGFFVNPTFSPYGGNFTASAGGVSCWLLAKVYAKPGYYVWRRTK